MKFITAGIVFLLILLFGYESVSGNSGSEPPAINARGAILVDFETGRVLFEKNSDEALAMASTTKIMTAMLAIESGRLGETVTVSKRAAAAPKMKMFLTVGEEISLELLLYALMLESSNDAAVAIAEHLSGSVEEFCGLMTEKARSLGALDTIFETPNGLDLGNHSSTAYDLSLITRYALKNEEFLKLINTRSHTGQSSLRAYSLRNKNRLLAEYSGANGVKTGFTGKAGYCFVGSAKRDDLWLVSVVLASGWGGRGREQRWEDTKDILNYGFENYKMETLVDGGVQAGYVGVERSRAGVVPVVYEKGVRMPLSGPEKESFRFDIQMPVSVKAPINAGDAIGSCAIYLGDEILMEMDILAAQTAERHDLKTSLEKVASALLGIVTSDKINITLPEF